MIIISRYNHITMGLLGYGGPMTVRWGEQMEKKKLLKNWVYPPTKKNMQNCKTNPNLVINHGILGYPIHYNCASDHGIQVTTPQKKCKKTRPSNNVWFMFRIY